MGLYDSIGGGFGGGNSSSSLLPHMEAIISKLGLEQALQGRGVPQAPPRTIINDLDDIFADLTSDQRKAIETNEEYMTALGNLLQKFLFFLLSKTSDGTAFIVGPGRKQAQGLLDITKKIAANLDQVVKSNYQQMAERMAQLEQVIYQQNMQAEARDKQLKEQQAELAKFKAELGVTEEKSNGPKP